ncbi:hypothetical protein H2204_000349 [Knufia peltigerae]|uniref:Uncharacterized protein n=1 Tax=Knufia peltigerae TaxID=1002370 RepID=A0AA38YF12_9EURO|nr:hypothetical protein H2204_000349 [Knufia peltigerae]
MFICLACGSAAFTTALAAVTYKAQGMAVAFILLAGFGVGGIEGMVYTLSPLTCEPEDIGLAARVMLLIRTSGPCIATSICSTVLNNKLSVDIPKYVNTAATDARLPASEVPKLIAGLISGNFQGIPDLNSQILAAAEGGYRQAYTQAFRPIYLSTIAWGAIGILAAIFSPSMGNKLDDFIGRRLQGKEVIELTENDTLKGEDGR